MEQTFEENFEGVDPALVEALKERETRVYGELYDYGYNKPKGDYFPFQQLTDYDRRMGRVSLAERFVAFLKGENDDFSEVKEQELD